MPQQSSVFPIHIRTEYRDDQQAFTRFRADVGNVTTFAENEFKKSGREISAVVKNALSVPRNALGSLDLGTDKINAAAMDAQDYARSLRQVEQAARRLAKETGDTSEETRIYLQAANAASREADETARSLTAQAATYERLQRAVNETTATTQRQIGVQRTGLAATNAATRSARAQRFAMVQVGQQFQDVAIQLQTNTRLSTIFVQQGSQLAFAMSGLGGKLGSVARVLAGPLGAAIAGAVTAFSLLRSTTDNNAEASDRAKQAGEELARSQLDIAKFFDVATGKIREQNKALIANAVAKRKELRFDLRDRIREDTENFIGAAAASTQRRADSRSPTGFVQSLDILEALNAEDREKALAELSLSDSVNANLAKILSDRLATIADTGERIRELNREIKSLETGTLDVGLRTGSSKSPKGGRSVDRAAQSATRETERLARVSDQSAEAIARINSQFDDQPALVDRSAAAIRKLDDIVKELSSGENQDTPRREELLAEERRVRALVEESISNEINRQVERGEDNLRIQTLIVQGREEEAEIVARIARFEAQFGLQAKIKEQREDLAIQRSLLETSEAGSLERAKAQAIIDEINASLAENVRNQQEINDAVRSQVVTEEQLVQLGQKRQEQLASYGEALGSVRTELEELFAGNGQDFFKNIRDSFRDLQAQSAVESIFGDAFRDIETALRRNTPLGRAETALESAMTRTGDTATDLATDFQTVSDVIEDRLIPVLEGVGRNGADQTIGAAANDNQNDLLVNGDRVVATFDTATLREFNRGLADVLTFPLLDKIDETFGIKFFSQMGDVLSGAVAGFLSAGPVGGVLGGLAKGLEDIEFKSAESVELQAKVLNGLNAALGGAQTGAQTAQILRGLGIKTSSTGGALGGAIGSVVPIPGGEIVGSILGSVVGGLFKGGNRTARANITGVDAISLAGADRGNFGTANTLAGSVIDGLQDIADRLDARIGSFNTTIGTRGDDFRVNPNGTSLKKKNGARDFGEDQAAAISFAIFDAISDGALQGLRTGTERLLKAAGDIEKGLEDALSFENVFRELEQRRDPLGFSLRTLNREFEDLEVLFNRAGASAAEFADLEELYSLRRAEIIEQAGRDFTSTLQGFLDDLTIGDNGLSVRDRLDSALTRFNPLAADVRAGNNVDAGQFEEAARAVLELERQVFGSQGNYFSRLDEITNLTEQALQNEQERLTAAANDNVALQFSIDNQTDILSGYLEQINRNIVEAINNGGFSGGNFGIPLSDRFAVNNF